MTTLPGTIQERIGLPGPEPGGLGEPSSALTPGDLLAMLRRRTVLIAVLFVVFSGLSVGGFIYWLVEHPGYRSECLIECVSNRPNADLDVNQDLPRQEEYDRFVATQAMLIKSRDILDDVLKLTAIKETNWYRNLKDGQRLLQFEQELIASPKRGTNLLGVAMVCKDRSDPATIVNAVVSEWRTEVERRSSDAYATDLANAQEERRKLDETIAEKRDRQRTILEKLPPGAQVNPAANITAQEVRQYGQQVGLLGLELNQLAHYRAIYTDPERVAPTPEDRMIVEQDPEVAQLVRTKFLLQQQRAADERIYGSSHRALKQLDAQILAAEEQLTQVRALRLAERQAEIREAANTAFFNTQRALFLAREDLATAEAKLQDQDRLLFEYDTLKAEIEMHLEHKKQLITHINTLDRIVLQRKAIDVRVAQPAVKPLKRHSPNLMLLPVAVFFSFALAVAIGLGLELIDTSVRTPQDIVRHLSIAMLGVIPDIDDEEVEIERVETAVRDNPQSMVAEAFRGIRTNLQFAAPTEHQRCLMITAARPEDGSTTVVSNLAIAVAQMGKRVLIIDANFRRPGIHAVFGKKRDEGLANILIGGGALGDFLQTTDSPLVDILPSGPTPPNPAELLGSERFQALINDAKSRYDQIMIDTAPVLLASDALVVGSVVDGTLLVVRANIASRGVARRATSLLTDVGARIFGGVLNAAQARRGGYFREQLRTYYDYHADAKPADLPGATAPRAITGEKETES